MIGTWRASSSALRRAAAAFVTFPAMEYAGVSSSREYVKAPTQSRRALSWKSSSSAKSASVSPGNPRRNVERIAARGSLPRISDTSARLRSGSPRLPMARRIPGEACWKGRSK